MEKYFAVTGNVSGAGNELAGKVLIATPNMNDSIFEKAVVFICAHDKEGTLGVVINKKVGGFTTQDVCDKFGIERKAKTNKKYPVLDGGPVDNEKLFILSATVEQEKKFDKKPVLTLYTNSDAFIKDIVTGKIKQKFLACRGFSSWGPGQLLGEVNEGSWFISNISIKDVFSGKLENLWMDMIKKFGVENPRMIVPYSGNA